MVINAFRAGKFLGGEVEVVKPDFPSRIDGRALWREGAAPADR
jgi:hypothetical protein